MGMVYLGILGGIKKMSWTFLQRKFEHPLYLYISICIAIHLLSFNYMVVLKLSFFVY